VSDELFSVLLALTLATSTIALAHLSSDLARLAILHNLAWSACLFTYGIGLVAYRDVATRAWFLITASIVAFNIGLLVGGGGPGRVGVGRDAGGRATRFRGVDHVLPVLYLVGLVAYLHTVANAFGLSSLVYGAQEVRSNTTIDEFPLVLRLGYFLGPILIVGYLLPGVSGTRLSRANRFAAIVLVSLGLASSLSRTLMFVSLVWAGTLLLLSKKADVLRMVMSRRGIALFVAALVAFQGLAFVTGKTGREDPRLQPYVSSALQGSALTSAVTYLSGGPAAFSALCCDTAPIVKSELGRLEGDGAVVARYTLLPLWKTLGQAASGTEVASSALVPFPHNAFTWIEPYYRDFGEVGVIVFPFMIGVIIASLARQVVRKPRYLPLLSLLVAITAWAPFVNKFISSFTWEYVLLMGILVVPLRGRRGMAVGRTSVTPA
jgi:hypothetical protein